MVIRRMLPTSPVSRTASGEAWDMWKKIAAQAENGEFGNPAAFCSDIEATNWMSATVATSNEEIIRHIIEYLQARSSCRQGNDRRYRYR